MYVWPNNCELGRAILLFIALKTLIQLAYDRPIKKSLKELPYVSGLRNSRTTEYENMNRKVTRDVTPKGGMSLSRRFTKPKIYYAENLKRVH